MALFAIADLHLSFGEDKPMDVFAGWNDYTSRLENNWSSNLEDIPQITPDWDKMMAEASDDAAKINQICGASNG